MRADREIRERLRLFLLYSAYDLRAPGETDDREAYFGALRGRTCRQRAPTRERCAGSSINASHGWQHPRSGAEHPGAPTERAQHWPIALVWRVAKAPELRAAHRVALAGRRKLPKR